MSALCRLPVAALQLVPMNEITQNLLQRVEEMSGKPVFVQADARIPSAVIRLARGTAPAHVVQYNPSLEDSADYVVSYQCGYALRILLAPEAERFDMQGTVRGSKDAETLIIQHMQKAKVSVPPELRTQIRDQIYDGLVRQLRSQPTGMRVDAWLRREYPELIDQQKSLVRQIRGSFLG